jgi:GNAT superfamily N-acetyltransferase
LQAREAFDRVREGGCRVGKHEASIRITIRDAVAEDASVLSDLAAQLGYPTASKDVIARLRRLKGKTDERVIVAADNGSRVVGWTTVRITKHMYSDPFVELSGFVVDQGARGMGVGKTMMSAVENWARERSISTVRLNANVMRTEAHKFYKAVGFENVKQQYVFQKRVE